MTQRLTLCACLVTGLTVGAAAFTFDSITQWTGTGPLRAALVIDWKVGPTPTSLAWGYRFDGTRTGIDMVTDVAASDPRLFLEITQYSFGKAITALGYDRDGDGFDRLDSSDLYQSGFESVGYFAYYLDGTPGSVLPNPWAESGTGGEGRTLTDGSWDGWSWAPGFSASAPSTPTAVPEPGTIVALAVGITAMRRRRRV